MGVRELNREQIIQLKEHCICMEYEDPSWSDIANADELISDEKVFNTFSGFNFVEEDFS